MADDAPAVLSKDEFLQRAREIFDACSDWMDGGCSAHGFWAAELGVYDKIVCECSGSFADVKRVELLNNDHATAVGLAIAIDEASTLIEDHGLAANCSTVVRSFYLAFVLQNLDWDLEAMLPGYPVFALEQ